ncbi:NDP-sugar epimerase, includes UDP-GlcNAc-inverting 4,6-dehydratase FlaA1 and capsular polysaccharide biosynthesis protein EpsC [Altererythrobacter xiamenensis]|uniref:NDP-sugar epimerase, includes UDP-GlcNAc-inverting 4,6-dehydratase FlaA1 and capsular polysaccharide biosynthesis protein EpsC n=1 Tax=Altererythrobacter xiamenensis TaxID=1316679 RepID=A0A1Y6F2G3_9SPHN|nr:nucleoside-diphosphate sugar epimerase/dehydratase [Altererythrobacter xiamenensis]SMQ69088.1 NDP-sugar epimerase, includes UDP-GlcNAc-inverting 4,6-dehydratase FlaA1 and capsular polysaccharide biosynthesis protein EpsC [Altererythrobacter xiamenensis]
MFTDILIDVLERLSRLARWQKQALVFSGDMLLLLLSVWVGYSLRVGTWILWSEPIQQMLIGCATMFIPVFYFAGVYRAIFRYAGLGMMKTLLKAFTVYTAMTFLVFMLIGMSPVPRTMGLLQPAVLFLFITAARLGYRFLFLDILKRNSYSGKIRRLLIYGAGDAGQQLASSVSKDPQLALVGYLDDDAKLIGHRLDGLPVYDPDPFEEVLKQTSATDVLLAMPGSPRQRRREIIAKLSTFDLAVKTLPPMREFVSGEVSLQDIRPVQIEDLLGREPVQPNELLLGRTIVGKTVLVTGAGGSIGSELCRQIIGIGATSLVLFEQNEYALFSIENELRATLKEQEIPCSLHAFLGSVCDGRRLDTVFSRFQVDTVFHAAAYKHVPLIEDNPVEGARNNVLGTQAMVQASHKAGVNDFVLVSTDKAVRPTNVMGATKRAAEQVVQGFAALQCEMRCSMVRFGNVLGSSGSVVPHFRKQIENGGPITLTHRDVVRYFMTIPEAANLVIQAAGLARGGEVFVLDMGEPIRIHDLAVTMIRLSGLKVLDANNPDGDIEIVEIGLRPGEKLYEELLIGENASPTKHQRIMMAQEGFMPHDELSKSISRLAETNASSEIVSLLQTIVPEFQHRRDDLVEAECASEIQGSKLRFASGRIQAKGDTLQAK